MYRKLRSPSLLRPAGISFVLGVAVFLLGVFLEHTSTRFGITGIRAVIDDLLIGILAGLLVLAYELHRHKAMLRPNANHR